MATDFEGLQGAGIGIADGGMLGQLAELAERGGTDAQQAAHFARTIDASLAETFGGQERLEEGFSLRSEVGR